MVVKGDDAPNELPSQGYHLDGVVSRVVDKFSSKFPKQGGERVSLAVAETSELG